MRYRVSQLIWLINAKSVLGVGKMAGYHSGWMISLKTWSLGVQSWLILWLLLSPHDLLSSTKWAYYRILLKSEAQYWRALHQWSYLIDKITTFYSHHWASLVARWKRIHLQCRRCEKCEFNPWMGKIPQEKEMATHSSILAWEIPWREESGRL